jgi:hypothetical protein
VDALRLMLCDRPQSAKRLRAAGRSVCSVEIAMFATDGWVACQLGLLIVELEHDTHRTTACMALIIDLAVIHKRCAFPIGQFRFPHE